MKYSVLLVCSICLISCGSAVIIDHEKDLDWSSYKTYQFYNDMESGLNELDDKRIITAIDSVLSQKDFQRTDYNQYYINFFVDEYIANPRNTIGVGLGSGGGGISLGGGVAIPVGGKKIHQKITIEFREASVGQRLVWQAVYEAELREKATPAQKEGYYLRTITKMLADFPPEKK